MNKYCLSAVSAAFLVSFALSSCETYPPGQATGLGAGIGAASGALIGAGAAGGRGAAIGAGAGLLAGALVGAAVDSENARYYHASGGYPFAQPTGTFGYVYSPYGQHNIIDVRGVPPGALVRDPSTGGIFRKP